MKSIIIKSLSSLFAAALVLGFVALGISTAFNAEEEGEAAKTVGVVQASPYVDGSTPTDKDYDSLQDGDPSLGINASGSSKPVTAPNGSVLMGGAAMPDMPGDHILMGNKDEESITEDSQITDEPVESEPVESEPVESEPVESEPVESEPVESEPVESEPVESEPVESEPVESEPVEDEPTDEPMVEAPSAPSINITNTLLGYNYTGGIDTFGAISGADTSDLYNAIHRGSNVCSFVAIRLSDGACIAYNPYKSYRCASSYKAFVSLYVYKQAAMGNLDLDTGLKYTYSDYYSGSGIIKSSPVGTVYSLRSVADYSIRYSDNIAFTMLQRYISRQGLVDYAKALGCPGADGFTSTWPNVSPMDAAIWWADIYNFSKTSPYGEELYNVCLNATNPSIYKGLNGEHPVAHKSGSISHYFHDAGVVESEDPYIIAIYTYNPNNYSSINQTYFSGLVEEIDKIINP